MKGQKIEEREDVILLQYEYCKEGAHASSGLLECVCMVFFVCQEQ